MAQTQRPLFFQFFLLTLTIFSFSNPTPLVYSLRQQKQQKQYFQVLDVSATIQKARQVFSNKKPQPTTLTTATTTLTNSSVLSLPLHPLDSIIFPKDQNYSALTISRLASDSARVSYINSKLRHALSKSGLKTDIPFQQEDLEAPVTLATGRHCARVGVGQPVKEFYLLLDTGSDVNWLQCLPCDACFDQSDPIFDPSQSSSYHPLSCASQQCTSLRLKRCSSANTCIYGVSYGDTSSTSGEYATETWSFGNSGSVDSVATGCGHLNQGFRGLSGIIGLSGGVASLTSQIKATSFSYCLVDIDSSSSSTLDFNSASPGDSVLVPLVTNRIIDIFYYVELTGIVIGGEQVSIPPSDFQIGNDGSGGIIVDSGTTVTRLQTQTYNSVRDTFLKYSQNLPKTSGFGIFDTCFNLPPDSNVTVPTVSFQFSGGKTLPLNVENYLYPGDTNGKFCLAFATTTDTVSIIGSTQQTGMRVTYDLANKLIGFSPNKC